MTSGGWMAGLDPTLMEMERVKVAEPPRLRPGQGDFELTTGRHDDGTCPDCPGHICVRCPVPGCGWMVPIKSLSDGWRESTAHARGHR